MKKNFNFLTLLTTAVVTLLFASCQQSNPLSHDAGATVKTDSTSQQVVAADTFAPDTPTEAAMRAMGLVDIQEVDPSIKVELKYATADNFTHEVLYTDIHKAFALPEVAENVKRAQKQLKAVNPEYSLLIYDAARPLSVQYKMWDVAQKTNTTYYVGDPTKRNGMHNFAAAVDATIIDDHGNPISMGTPFDWFGVEAHITNEEELVKKGAISQQELDNRLLLRKVMTDNGMLTIRSEWWHFEYMHPAEAREKLTIVE